MMGHPPGGGRLADRVGLFQVILGSFIDRVVTAIASIKAILIAIAITGALCLLLGYCRGKSEAETRASAERYLANAKVQQVDAVAKD